MNNVEYGLCDALLVSSKANKYYLGGRYSSRGFVLLVKGEAKPRHFIDYRSVGEGREGYIINKNDNPLEVVCHVIASLPINVLGIETDDITVDQYFQMKQLLNDCEIVDANIRDMRVVKTADEIARIQLACDIADRSYIQTFKKIKSGMTEKEIAQMLEIEMYRNGADSLAFETIVASGPNSANPHAKPTNRKIEHGDFVTIDFGVKVSGYCSDTTRSFLVGDAVNIELLSIYEIVLEAFNRAYNAIKPGRLMCEIDGVARSYIDEQGYGPLFLHHLGHGVGIECHEPYRLSEKSKHRLQEGMVVTLEPGIYIPNIGGVRIEDTVLVTQDGAKTLNQLDKSLKKLRY